MTDPQTLLTQAQCYACYGASIEMLMLMRLALLRQWLLLLDPGADTSPQTLLNGGRCYFCAAGGRNGDIYALQLLRLALVKQAAAGAETQDVGRITEEEEPRITEEGELRFTES